MVAVRLAQEKLEIPAWKAATPVALSAGKKPCNLLSVQLRSSPQQAACSQGIKGRLKKPLSCLPRCLWSCKVAGVAALLPEQTASYQSGIWQGQVAHRDRPLNKDVSHTLSCYSVNSSFNLLRSLKVQPTSNLWIPPFNATLSDLSQHSVMQSKIMIILQIKLSISSLKIISPSLCFSCFSPFQTEFLLSPSFHAQMEQWPYPLQVIVLRMFLKFYWGKKGTEVQRLWRHKLNMQG